MNQIQRIAKNIGVTGATQIITALMAFLLAIYLARFLGEADFGKYNFALSLTTLLAIFTDLGVNQLIIREIAREKGLSTDYVNNSIILKIPLSILTLIFIAIISQGLSYHRELSILLYLFGIYNILFSITGVYTSLFTAWEKMEYVALFQIIERIIIVTFSLWILFLGYGVIGVAYVYLLAGIIDVVVVAYIAFKRFIRPVFKIDFGLQKKLLRMGLPFGLNALFAVFFFKIDTVLLGILKGDVAVGVYNAAYNPLLSLSMIIGGIISTVIYPIMSKYYKESGDALEKLTLISSKYLAILGFPIAFGCFILADKFIQLFYAGGYTQSVLAFQILALFIPIRLVSSITGTLLSSINRQGYRTASVGISAAFNIILNLMLIPYYSYIGASIATVLSELILYGLFIFYIRRYYKDVKVSRTFTKPLIASLIMVIAIQPIKDSNLFITLGMATIIYFSSLLLLKTFGYDDEILFKSLLGKET